ncbi:PREDICTED: leucine-rich repeat flightless-interacting protein 2-like isoform X6 [Cyprinodon variegatus]|uniref:leucine-rich repeat flightless-interacting protein 2-like isoform X6 n=1 Tax=Cyprinodon variegatus TaxID=28743 RepID=UPI00074254C7|nr:PREDICTED: leucine-rich repeat flightless-interacting protein 2-like isoform X6 [Cyprinodon variegatus]
MLTCFYVCPSDRSTSAPQAEARLAAKRAARAEAREIRMKELERQQKELFHSTKKYYGLDNKWGHIEQWMEDSERYSRLSRRHASVSDDEERMSVGSRGSYRPSDYGGLLGSSSRASSRASSARASPVVEERADREFMEKGSRTASTLSAATLASLGGASSRRGSCDTSFSVETEASIREMKDSLLEAEEKYRRAMISNAQLHNDKTTLMFQVENLREELSDMEELLWEARRRWEESSKELERERQANSVLKGQFKEMEDRLRQTNETLTEVSDLRLKSSSYCQEVSDLQEALQWKEKKIAALERHRETSDIVRIERDRLRDEVVRLRDSLKNHGVVFSPDTSNGDVELADDDSASPLAEDPPHSGRESVLELRMKKLFEDREGLRDQVRLLKSQLDQRSSADGVQNPGGNESGIDPHLLELQRDHSRQISELKFKLVKSEQEVTTLEQNVLRLEGQVCRYKSASENAERIEDELKVEKRRLQRELRSALDRIEELEVSNSHLSKRLEKMKANRNALLSQQ